MYSGTALNGFPTPVLAGGGDFNAETDQSGPGNHVLSQFVYLTTQSTSGGTLQVYQQNGSQNGVNSAPVQQFTPNDMLALWGASMPRGLSGSTTCEPILSNIAMAA